MDIIPEEYYQTNHNAHRLVSYINQIMALFKSEDYTAIPNLVHKAKQELECHNNKLNKDYISLVKDYLIVVQDFCHIPEQLTFYFNGNAVGILSKAPSKIEKIIHYEPVRGVGHYSLREELQDKTKVVCELYISESIVLISVSETDEIQHLLVGKI